MITKEVTVTATPEEVAQLLFELDSKQVADVFALWAKLFEDNFTEMHKQGKPVHIFDLPHFMLYVANDLDDDGKKLIRDLYAMVLYKVCNEPYKKHLAEIL